MLPVNAKINGNISQSYFYDLERTIMSEVAQSQEIKTGKYWEKNFFVQGKYRPIFLLSNKELYNFVQKPDVKILREQKIPSIYNVSLKNPTKKIQPTPTPSSAQTYCDKAEMYYAMGNYEQAMKNFIQSYRIDPTNKQSCLGIAKILNRTNRELAQKYYSKAASLN